MMVFFKYFKTYFSEDFKWAPHLLVLAFCIICTWLNFEFEIYQSLHDEYRTWRLSFDQETGKPMFEMVTSLKWPLSILAMFAFAFFSAVAIVSAFKKEKTPILNWKFIGFAIIGLIFVSFDTSYYFLQYATDLYSEEPAIRDWQHQCLSNVASLMTIIIPLYIIYYSVKHFKPEFYGLKLNGARVGPYFWLILLMTPLIVLASFQPDFLESYPSYNDYGEYELLKTPQYVTVIAFELCYGFDFLSVELFFRGFMVVALSRFAGKDAILPMVAVYCFLHFGKPMGEAISSIFGGYILGILAYESRNIYGGLVVHLGVAWGMELMAWLQS